MTEDVHPESGAIGASAAQPTTPGATLRAAREAQGLSLSDVATRTRIAQRQLEAIERDDYAALPGIPYAVGFARAYARTIGMDEVAIAADVRRAVNDSDLGTTRYEAFEPVDPARVPPRKLAWVVAIVVVALVAGYTIWRTQLLTPPTGEEIAQGETRAAPSPAAGPRPVPPAAQPVVFTAVDDVWLRIYDEAGERLKDGLLKKSEQFTLPPGAKNPMILTGRPQALSVTVGGKPIPPLGEADRTIADVPVSAEALLARGAAPPVNAAPPPVPAPTRRATPRRAAPSAVPTETAAPASPALEPAPAAPAAAEPQT
ncbi:MULTISPECIES: helix-turn-helix domain-containing protein [unclassified Sphingobium]|uniref:helix-turn-helix domain-containing protein n=1 Tax=unclassified Sphingobium TaxID=2611147 RepID=UPI0035A724AA